MYFLVSDVYKNICICIYIYNVLMFCSMISDLSCFVKKDFFHRKQKMRFLFEFQFPRDFKMRMGFDFLR